jgi:hypothetical protein
MPCRDPNEIQVIETDSGKLAAVCAWFAKCTNTTDKAAAMPFGTIPVCTEHQEFARIDPATLLTIELTRVGEGVEATVVPSVVFVSQGEVDGVAYVDVVHATGDPIDYGIPLSQAVADYGQAGQVSNPGELS